MPPHVAMTTTPAPPIPVIRQRALASTQRSAVTTTIPARPTRAIRKPDASPGCITCPAGSPTAVTRTGGGQNPSTVDKQIQTSFTVINNSGCIVSWTKSSVTATKGTILQYDANVGNGPQPSTCTLNGVAIARATTHQITLPATSGTAGKLYLDNKANGGKDADRITVSAQ